MECWVECSVLFSIVMLLSAAACSCMFSGVKDMDTRRTAITIGLWWVSIVHSYRFSGKLPRTLE